MSFCTKCGRRLTAGVSFCTACGASVPQPAPTQATPSGEADGHVALVRSSAGRPGADARHDEAGPAALSSPAPPPSGPAPRSPARDSTTSPRPRLEGQRATIALVAAAALIAGGIIAGFQIAGSHGHATAGHAVASQQHRSPAPAQTAALAPVENSSASPTASESGSSGPATSAPASPASPASSASSRHATAVAIGPLAAEQPDAAKVAAFLSRYFAAINNRNYPAYAALFAANALPTTTARQFRNGYRSTRDSNAELVNLMASPAGLAASVTFRSHQSAAASATHTSCTLWGVTFYLQPDASSYLIGPPPAGYQASYHPCP